MRFETIFGIFILFLLIIAGGFNARAATVSLNPSSLNVYATQTFNVNVTVDPQGIGIAGAQLNIEFNKSTIDVNGIAEGDLFKQNGASTIFNGGVINNSSGVVGNIYSAIIGPFNVSAPGTFIIINMTAVGAGTSGINLSNAKISDPYGVNIALNVINGSVSINGTPTQTPLQPTTSGSSGGGGGGGGGGSSGENYNNIEFTEKHDLFIFKDLTTSYVFKKTEPIVFVNITGNKNAGEINVAVEVLRNTSSLVNNSLEGVIYKNVNIWVGTSGFATPKNIKQAEITFRVPKAWIETNKIDPGSINMARYDGGWQSLPTQKISENAEEVNYVAGTNSFSPLAITGKKSDVKGISLFYSVIENLAPLKTAISEKAVNEPGSHRGLDILFFIGASVAIATIVYGIRKTLEK